MRAYAHDMASNCIDWITRTEIYRNNSLLKEISTCSIFKNFINMTPLCFNINHVINHLVKC